MFVFGRDYRQKIEAIHRMDQAATKIHRQNVKAIASANKTADNLKQVLEANGITIKIQKATGHKHDNRNHQSALQS